MQMEVDFFSAQPGTGPPPAIRMLVVDFDDTCTATDTTSQIFNTATSATVESSAGQMCNLSMQSVHAIMLSFDHDKIACHAVSRQLLLLVCCKHCNQHRRCAWMIKRQHISPAESEKADVQNRLGTLKDKLVQNYVHEQQKLYAELLPEVTYQQPCCFPPALMNAHHYGSPFCPDLLVSDSHQAVLLRPPWQRFSCRAASNEVH